MDWQSWTVSDWNKALVEAVFFGLDRLDQRITRIQASSEFLAQCTGDPSCKAEAAQRAFISSFGTFSAAILQHFSWSKTIPASTGRNQRPEVFAALYLTLLAASADEDTYSEGNFRNRFVELLKPVNVAAPTFGDLPQLWKHVEAWSRARAKQHGDCRILCLPDPGHESRIGHSKRLAFPAYRDEIHLQSLLQDRGLSSRSRFRDVAGAIASHHHDFSSTFLEEFTIFQTLVARARLEEAYNSPLWGAVQTITWDVDKATAQRIGSFCLGVEAADSGWPEFYLLTDERGRSSLGPAIGHQKLPVSTNYLYAAHLHDRAPWTPASLLGLAVARPRISQAKLWRHLGGGCAALFPDSQSGLSSDGEFYDGAPVCLLVHEKLEPYMRASMRHLGPKPVESQAGALFGAWSVLFFSSLSAGSMERIAERLPDSARQGLPCSWNPPKISCTGGAWYGQSLLLSPASVPLFAIRGADFGFFELSGGTANVSGELEEADGKFRIPPLALSSQEASSACISLSRSGEVLGELRIPLARHIPMNPPLRLSDPRAWLADGAGGRLAGLCVEDGTAAQKAIPVRMLPLHPQFARSNLQPHVGAESKDLDSIPEPLGWLCEALTLRLQGRQTLSFADLNSHLKPASSAAGVPYWVARKLLFNAGWLIQLQKRNSPHPAVAAAPRTIAFYGMEGDLHTARIVGMLSESERAFIRTWLGSGEAAVRHAPAGGLFGIGAIHLQLASSARIAELAEQLQLDVLSKDAGRPPLALPPELFKLDHGAADAIRNSRDTEVWEPLRRQWVPIRNPDNHLAPGGIVRISRQQRRAYWVAAPGGWLETDSEAWAFMLALAAEGKPLGQIDAGGSCWLASGLDRLPYPLVRWWMHWGGGCVVATPEGSIVLVTGSGEDAWNDLRSWLPFPAKGDGAQSSHDIALERRKLALRLRVAKQQTGY
jgi:hypothetical protein